MGLRGHRKKRQERKALEQARRELESVQGSYAPPAREDCEALDWWYYADENSTLRVHTYTWRQNGRLADFTIVFLVPGPGREEELERIDCSHGHCHLHPRNGTCVGLVPIDTIEDVQRAYDITEGIAQDRVRILQEGGNP